eukprot:5837925-Amphidinium_carterae.2
MVVSRKKGDDEIAKVRNMLTSAWLTYLLLDQVTRWSGFEGKPLKILLSSGYSECVSCSQRTGLCWVRFLA